MVDGEIDRVSCGLSSEQHEKDEQHRQPGTLKPDQSDAHGQRSRGLVTMSPCHLPRRAVLPGELVQTNPDEIGDHAKAVADHPYLGVVGMTPSHGDLTDAQPAPRSQEENLRIEAKAVDGLFLEERTRPIPVEQLEPALRVVKLQPQTDAHQAIEQNATGLAKSGLVSLNLTSIDRARPDDDISRIPLRDVVQLEKLVDRSREIRIGEENICPGRPQHAGPDAVSFAAAFIVVDEPDAVGFETPDDRARPIGRAVVHDQDLEGKRRSSEELTQLAERVGDSARFVESRDDDRDSRRKRVARAHHGRRSRVSGVRRLCRRGGPGIWTRPFRPELRT